MKWTISTIIWLERWYDYRRIDWTSKLEYPEFTFRQAQQLLTFVEKVKKVENQILPRPGGFYQ